MLKMFIIYIFIFCALIIEQPAWLAPNAPPAAVYNNQQIKQYTPITGYPLPYVFPVEAYSSEKQAEKAATPSNIYIYNFDLNLLF